MKIPISLIFLSCVGCLSKKITAQTAINTDSLLHHISTIQTPDKQVEAYCRAAFPCFYQGKKAEAYQCMDKALSVAMQNKGKDNLGKVFATFAGLKVSEQSYDEGINYVQKGLAMKAEFKEPTTEAYLNQHYGTLLVAKGKHEEATDYLSKAEVVFKESEDGIALANTYKTMGVSKKRQKRYSAAIQDYFSALDALNQTDTTNEKFNRDSYLECYLSTYNNMTSVYSTMGDNVNCLKYNTLAIAYSKKIYKPKSTLTALSNQADFLIEAKKYDEALNVTQEIVTLSQKVKMPLRESEAYLQRAQIAHAQQDNVAWKMNLEKAYALSKTAPTDYTYVLANLGLGQYTLQQQHFAEALQFANTAADIQAKRNDKSALTDLFLLQSDCYKGLKRYDLALEKYQAYSHERDSLMNKENIRNIEKAASSYEAEKAENIKKIELAEQKQWRNITIVLLGLASLLAFTLYLRFRTKKQAAEAIAIEKERSDTLLLNILPAEVAEELKLTGKATAKGYANATVLFADIKNFTLLSENLSPENLVKEIDFVYSNFDAIINRYPIEKVKTIGDAYLCAGGIPTTNESHAFDIVHAAIEMQQFMQTEFEKRTAEGRSFFHVRIGIHTGPLVAGVVGIRKFAYDIWGDTVNIAARMEQNSEAGKVNISEATYEIIKDQWTCTPRGEIEVKNKGQMKMFYV